MKYVRNFGSLKKAKSETCYSTALVLIKEETEKKVISYSTGIEDDELYVIGDTIKDSTLRKKEKRVAVTYESNGGTLIVTNADTSEEITSGSNILANSIRLKIKVTPLEGYGITSLIFNGNDITDSLNDDNEFTSEIISSDTSINLTCTQIDIEQLNIENINDMEDGETIQIIIGNPCHAKTNSGGQGGYVLGYGLSTSESSDIECHTIGYSESSSGYQVSTNQTGCFATKDSMETKVRELARNSSIRGEFIYNLTKNTSTGTFTLSLCNGYGFGYNSTDAKYSTNKAIYWSSTLTNYTITSCASVNMTNIGTTTSTRQLHDEYAATSSSTSSDNRLIRFVNTDIGGNYYLNCGAVPYEEKSSVLSSTCTKFATGTGEFSAWTVYKVNNLGKNGLKYPIE